MDETNVMNEADDVILVPRGWLGAACYALDKQRQAPVVLAHLRAASTTYPRVDTAAQAVLIERRRQVAFEGWTHEHDDAQRCDELAALACFYAMPPAARDWVDANDGHGANFGEAIIPAGWVAKPGDRRGELVKAGALILAEIERLDREASRVSK